MKKIITLVLICTSVLLLTACGGNKLIGTWEGKTEDGIQTTFIFKSGNKVEYKNEVGFNSTGTYKINKDEVTINLESWDKEKVYKFEVKDKKLSLTATDSYSLSYKDMEKK